MVSDDSALNSFLPTARTRLHMGGNQFICEACAHAAARSVRGAAQARCARAAARQTSMMGWLSATKRATTATAGRLPIGENRQKLSPRRIREEGRRRGRPSAFVHDNSAIAYPVRPSHR